MAVNQKRGPFPVRSKWLLGGTLVALGAWFAWGAWSQWQAGRVLAEVEQARDAAVEQIANGLAGSRGKLVKALEDEGVRQALAHGDLAALQLELGRLVGGMQSLDIQPQQLTRAYEDPKAFGWSRLALLEAALSEGTPLSRVVKDAGSPHLGLAAPVTVSNTASVLYLRLPLEPVSSILMNADIAGSAYLGLRQGRYTVAEQGDASLAGSADALARSVPDAGMRVVAAVGEVPTGPLGMGTLSSVIVALLLWLIAALVGAGGTRVDLPTLLAARRRRAEADADDSATFGETIKAEAIATPVPRARPAADVPPPADAPAATSVEASMFRAYDIRGVVGKELDARAARLIGQAIGSELIDRGLREIVVGRDGRLSGEELSAALVEGLRSTGCDVTDIGLAPTPVAYFAAYHLRTGSCVVVTGSHNPPRYNGFKIVLGGETLYGDGINALYDRIASGRLQSAETPGSLAQREVLEDYIARIAGDVQLERPLKVVADAGNGVAGLVAPALLEAIGAEVIPLFCDVDGNFPNHHPDPSEPANLEDLVATVKRFGADIGIAFDGDGDRLGVVTPDGKLIYADRLLMLFAADVLMRSPGGQIIYDVKCTGQLSEFILLNGGSPLMWKTGHSLIKAKMRETDAELAGEMSGHFFFKERWYGFDDGLYAAARLLEILAQREETPEEVLAAIPEAVSTPEIKVSVDDGSQHALVALFTAAAQSPDSPLANGRLSTVDGLRADFVDGWGLLRASNTTSVLVLRFEGQDEAAMSRIRQMFRDQLDALLPGTGSRF